ncbi:MAG: HisA/HisF-related TIM barrel protein [Methanomassiliicoccales archaeon]
MKKEKKILACPYCGSVEIVPKVIFGGPLPGIDAKNGTYVCEKCEKEAVPLHFRTFEEWSSFFGGVGISSESGSAFFRIPVLPIDTVPFLSIGRIEFPIGKVARVSNIVWRGNALASINEGIPFDIYLKTVFGKNYSANAILLMDLAGINEGKPNFKVLKELTRKNREIWLDIGMHTLQDLFDSYAMEVSRAIINTSTANGLRIFEEAFELSDRCMPCIYFDKEIRWAKRNSGPADLKTMANMLKKIGYEEMAVIDINHLGSSKGVSKDFVKKALANDLKVYIGGGVVETDLDLLEKEGATGALIDPHTPMIRSLLENDDEKLHPSTFSL